MGTDSYHALFKYKIQAFYRYCENRIDKNLVINHAPIHPLN